MNAFHRIKHFLPFCVTFILAFPQKGSIAELERKIAPKPILLGFWEEAVVHSIASPARGRPPGEIGR
jgi:hypothetical protein